MYVSTKTLTSLLTSHFVEFRLVPLSFVPLIRLVVGGRSQVKMKSKGVSLT